MLSSTGTLSGRPGIVALESSILLSGEKLLMLPGGRRAGLAEPSLCIVERPPEPAPGDASRSLQTPSHNLQRRTAHPDQQLGSCSVYTAELQRPHLHRWGHVTAQLPGEAYPRERPPAEPLRRMSSGGPQMLDARTAAATAFGGLTGAACGGSPVLQRGSLPHQASRPECADAMDVLRHIVSLTQRQGSSSSTSNSNGSSNVARAPAHTGDTPNHAARCSPEAAAGAKGQWAAPDRAASGHLSRTALLDGNVQRMRGPATSALAEGPVPTGGLEQATWHSRLPHGPAHACEPRSAPADPAPQRHSSFAAPFERLAHTHSSASVALLTGAVQPCGGRPTARDVPAGREQPSPPPVYDSPMTANQQPNPQVVSSATWHQQVPVPAPALPQQHTPSPPQPPSHLSASPPTAATFAATALNASRGPPPQLPPRPHPNASPASSARRSPLETQRLSPLTSSTAPAPPAAAAHASARAAGVPTDAPVPGVQLPDPVTVTVIPSKCSDDKDIGRTSDGSGGGLGRRGHREVQGTFCPKRYLDNVECVLCEGEWLSRSAFERVGALTWRCQRTEPTAYAQWVNEPGVQFLWA